MLTADNYRAMADTAFEDAQEYRDCAEKATDEARRSRLLKYADNRESDGLFYLDQAWMAEEHDRIREAKRRAA